MPIDRPYGHSDTIMWITGHVVDQRGRALSGVAVEVRDASMAKRQAALSNASGRFVVCDLRPGVYTVTFARPGFFTERRKAVELGTFVATVNAQMQTLEA